MEEIARNIDRLATVSLGGRWVSVDKKGTLHVGWTIVPLYEAACKKLDGKPISLVAAQRLIEGVKPGDRVLLVASFYSPPSLPYGETDGPLGAASLARAVCFGLRGIPVLVAGPNELQVLRHSVKVAGMNIYPSISEIKETTHGVGAVEVAFPIVDKEEGKKVAANILDEYAPKAVICVETAGPNRKGVKHSGLGAELKGRLPSLEHLFLEASARGILSIGIIDGGNEIGSGTIEEDVRRIVPDADVCKCPCGGGSACAVKTDIVFPASISNWGAYAITAMVAFLLRKPDILQDAETERRMLEACIESGATDDTTGRTVMGVDRVGHESHEALVTMLHSIIRVTTIRRDESTLAVLGE
ncbi:glutamate cyclase domain-containing protein [Chloroflexota bacterium]